VTLKIELDEVLRMALEALEELHYSSGTVVAARKYELATAALRKALAEPELNLNCKSVQKRLATVWGYVKAEQAEQSQLADATLEPVAWFVQYKNRHEFVFGSKPESIVDGVVEPLYAAPLAKQDTHATHVVRTKDPCNPLQDLTDDEIRFWIGRFPFLLNEKSEKWVIGLARAVIAADREKNK